MKKVILSILLFLCFAPMYSMIDNYEDLISQGYFNIHGIYYNQTHETIGGLGHFQSNNDPECFNKFDGTTIQPRFVPFGTLVTACSDDYYFHLFGFIKLHFKKN